MQVRTDLTGRVGGSRVPFGDTGRRLGVHLERLGRGVTPHV